MLTPCCVSRLREVSDVAKMQVSALEARQQSREKEVEALRRQVLDYQVTQHNMDAIQPYLTLFI